MEMIGNNNYARLNSDLTLRVLTDKKYTQLRIHSYHIILYLLGKTIITTNK